MLKDELRVRAGPGDVGTNKSGAEQRPRASSSTRRVTDDEDVEAFASTSGVSHHDHNGQTAARLLNCIFQSSVGLTPVESAESSRQMPVANRVVPAQADNCRYAYHEAATLYIREMLFRDRSTNV